MGVSYMTQEGYDKLRAELDHHKTKGREEVANAIAEAREKGDLSENAEYDTAMSEKDLIKSRINEINMILTDVEIIEHQA